MSLTITKEKDKMLSFMENHNRTIQQSLSIESYTFWILNCIYDIATIRLIILIVILIFNVSLWSLNQFSTNLFVTKLTFVFLKPA